MLKSFVLRIVSYTQNNPLFPKKGPIKNFFTKPLYLSRTNNEKVKDSKRSPKNSHACVPLNVITSEV
jgi:hypothetical protein